MPSRADFNPVVSAKALLRTSTTGALATLQIGSGNPFCSLVNTSTLPDGSPILLISRLAVHTRNILHDPRVSLLFSEAGTADPLASPRISLTGTAAMIEDELQETAFRRYLAAHPTAEVFASFADFSFYRVAIAQGHLVAGFGRIIDLSAPQLLTDVSDAAELLAAEEGAVAHMNADHADAVRLYATKLLGAVDGDWRMISVDPEGCDLAHGAQRLRLSFPERVTDATALRKTLVALVAEARG
jgi:heme iron utilization protein